MAERRISPRRSRETTKPRPECPDVVVYRCRGRCGGVYQLLTREAPAHAPECCGAPAERLRPVAAELVSPELTVDYRIVGGHDESAVEARWEAARPEDRPDWVLLKTFTGSYLQRVDGGTRPLLVFPLAGKDAYTYCDEKVCLECVFRCKRGFALYLYLGARGLLLELPLERMVPTGQPAG